MLIIQHNCRRAYAITIAALEVGLERQAGIVCLQEPYIKREFRHAGYLIYWPEEGEHRNHRVAVAVRKDLLSQKIFEARTDLLNHPYLMVIDVWDLDRSGNRARRTRIINCYDNWLGEGCCWQGSEARRRRAIEDAEWGQLLQGRCLVLGDFNAHSPLWNPQSARRAHAGPLEPLIEQHDLLVTNDPEEPTRPKSTPGISIIDLSITSQDLGLLPRWLIDRDCSTGSDHELILMEWDDIGENPQGKSNVVTGWRIQELLADGETLERAAQAWR